MLIAHLSIQTTFQVIFTGNYCGGGIGSAVEAVHSRDLVQFPASEPHVQLPAPLEACMLLLMQSRFQQSLQTKTRKKA